MKKSIAILVVLVVVAAIGFAGFWIGRSGSPTGQARNAIAVAPTLTQSTSGVSGPATVATVPGQEKVTPKRLQSTYVPQANTPNQQSTATEPPANHGNTQLPNPGRPAAELITAIETDDPKSVFQNPAVAAHQAMLSEAPDPDWSQMAAQQLRDYLAAQLGNRFEYPLVQCGQDICEIQAASFVGGNSDADLRDFQDVDYNMQQQPWWTTLQFDQLSFQVQASKNGRHLDKKLCPSTRACSAPSALDTQSGVTMNSPPTRGLPSEFSFLPYLGDHTRRVEQPRHNVLRQWIL